LPDKERDVHPESSRLSCPIVRRLKPAAELNQRGRELPQLGEKAEITWALLPKAQQLHLSLSTELMSEGLFGREEGQISRTHKAQLLLRVLKAGALERITPSSPLPEPYLPLQNVDQLLLQAVPFKRAALGSWSQLEQAQRELPCASCL